jgi:hypothetical protein
MKGLILVSIIIHPGFKECHLKLVENIFTNARNSLRLAGYSVFTTSSTFFYDINTLDQSLRDQKAFVRKAIIECKSFNSYESG